MHIVLSDSAYSDILHFVEQYQDFLTKPFFDTWLDGEEQIRENYIHDGEVLGREIYQKVVESLSRELIPYEELQEEKKLSVIRHGSRLIFVYYIEKFPVREIVQIEIFHR